MKKLLLLVTTALLLGGCEKIEGQLNVVQDLKLINSNNISSVLRVGTYSADIKTNTSKKITIRLNNNSDEKFIFNLPEGSKIPTNGEFSFTAKEVGQPVDLSGSVVTLITETARMQSSKSCTYTQDIRICTPGPFGGQICTIDTRVVPGKKWMTYFDRTTNKDVLLSIKAQDQSEEIAQFQGDISLIERIVVKETKCR